MKYDGSDSSGGSETDDHPPKKRFRTKDSHLYGDFNGEDEETYSNVRNKQTTFVSAKHNSSEDHEDDSDSPSDDQMEEEKEENTPRGLGFSKKPQQPIKPVTQNTFKPPDKDFGKFQKHTTGFGLRMMQKQGYTAGEGLGKDGKGIVKPIDVKLRPTKAGLGLIDERTEAVKDEQRKKSKKFVEKSSDLNNIEKKKVGGDGWKKKKKLVKDKVLYVTAEELVAQQERFEGIAIDSSKILDLTGKVAREVSRISDLSTSKDSLKGRLPELRNNLKELVRLAQTDLLNSSKAVINEKRSIEEKRNMKAEIERVLLSESKRQERLSTILQICTEFNERVRSQVRPVPGVEINDLFLSTTFEKFDDIFSKLSGEYSTEFVDLKLDELIISALSPALSLFFRNWDPLIAPTLGTSTILKWKSILFSEKLDLRLDDMYGLDSMQIDIIGSTRAYLNTQTETMSSYESFLYQHWLPKVRSAINNNWNPKKPDQLYKFLESWHPAKEYQQSRSPDVTRYASKECIIPYWMFHNLIDQLIIPKIKSELQKWNPKPTNNNEEEYDDESLYIHTWLHVWLPLIDLSKLETHLFEPFRFKLGMFFGSQQWHPRDNRGVSLLAPWKEVFGESVIDQFCARHILPKLKNVFGNEFVINPAEQDMEGLVDWVIPWSKVFTKKMFGELIQDSFFPLWHEVLFVWFMQPKAIFAEIGEWFKVWKEMFTSLGLSNLREVKEGFKVGLDMMNSGMKGSLTSIPTPKSKLDALAILGSKSSTTTSKKVKAKRVTFKDLVEQKVLDEGLFLIKVGKSHEKTGKTLFRIAIDPKGSRGVTVYFDEDVLFCEREVGRWDPVGISEAVDLAFAKFQK